MGVMIGDEPAWIERRRDRRVQACFEIVFKILDADEFEKLDSEMRAAAIPALPKGGGESLASTVNLSLSGLCIDGDFQLKLQRPLSNGTRVAIEFYLPDQPGVIRSLAEIAWAQPPEVVGGSYSAGLKFLRMDQEAQRRLENFVSRAS
jgi:hypothetical protein